MKKTFLSSALIALLLISVGCSANKSQEPSPSKSPAIETPQSASSVSAPTSSQETDATSSATASQHPAGMLTKDAYDGITIDAFVRERKAILPGFAIPVTVTVRNTGDQTIDYVQGSGSYKIPDAISLAVDGLQTVPSEDRLGIATMDFVTTELKPGDSLEFVLHVMAIEPNENFNTYAREIFDEDGQYIANIEWPKLADKFPDLALANPGIYDAHAYFVYYMRGESDFSDFTAEPSSYAQIDFTLSIS